MVGSPVRHHDAGRSKKIGDNQMKTTKLALSIGCAIGLICSPILVTQSNAAEQTITPDLTTIGAAETAWQIFGVESPGFATAQIGGKTCVERKGKPKDAVDGSVGAIFQGVVFSEGVIEVDLKGYDRKQGSFVGVLFHAVDGQTYDAVYFRPFNFESADTESLAHCVQYISPPQWRWNNLRREKPGQFENAITPTLKAEEWFHARIEVDGETIRVFVNDSAEPSLSVKKLNERKEGLLGLWVTGQGAFANLKVSLKSKQANKSHAGDGR
jgi:hypothetical protein